MSNGSQTLLEQHLKAYIHANGPISTRAFMEACLYDPEHGYYRAGNPIGADGDFITAPEISQMFGEMIGIWCVLTWQAMGGPMPLQLIELGPGRGTLMSDVLRCLSQLHPHFEVVSVHMVERSVNLRAAQMAKLEPFSSTPKQWYENLSDVPAGPSLLIANEFLDCLPVRQFVKTDQAWHERVVSLDETGQFCFAVGEQMPKGMIVPDRFVEAGPGSIFEFCPDFEGLVDTLHHLAQKQPFAGLFIDYGFEGPALGETLQALHRHKMVSPFIHPGEVDLTAHVDFTALAALCVAHGLKAYGPKDQGAFLSQLGIGTRAEKLVENASEPQAETLIQDVVRLVAPEQMGSLFKVMSITSSGLAVPPPFDQRIEASHVSSTN